MRGGCARPVPTCNYLKPPPESLRNPGALFFRPKTASKWPKTTKNRQNTCFLRYFALFLAQKSARRVCTTRTTCNYLKPPPESLRNPSALFFRPKTASKWPKTTKTVKIRIILRYFALFLAQKSARRVRTPRANLQLPQYTPSRNPSALFFRPKTASKWPKTVKYALV